MGFFMFLRRPRRRLLAVYQHRTMQLHFATLASLTVLYLINGVQGKACSLQPLGQGKDDTTQILEAIEECGHHGHTTFAPGSYNITR